MDFSFIINPQLSLSDKIATGMILALAGFISVFGMVYYARYSNLKREYRTLKKSLGTIPVNKATNQDINCNPATEKQ